MLHPSLALASRMPSATPYGMQGRERDGVTPLTHILAHPCLGSLGMGSHQWEGRYAVIDNKGKVVNTLYFTRLYYNPFNYLPHLKRSLIAVFRQTKLCEAISKGNGSVLNKFIIFSIFTFSQNKFK